MNFKLIIEESLQRLDNFFKEKSQKDVYMVYLMLFAVFSAVAYPFYDSSVEEFNTVKSKVADVSTKINADKIYLQVNPEAKIAKLNQDILALEAELLVTKNNNEYIKSKIETISSLIYDEVAWGQYLNSISINAKMYDIKIVNFTNEYVDSNESFGHVLDIALEVTGNYSNTVKFINSLEKSELVVDLHDFSVKALDDLNTSLNISVWGITY
jgi:Tfp pilus assembly protein PilO